MKYFQIAIAAAGMLASAPVLAASGTVTFGFTSFRGPVVAGEDPALGYSIPPYATGLVNNAPVPLDGGFVVDNPEGITGWSTGAINFGVPLPRVSFRYTTIADGSLLDNFISFAPADFNNVSLGQNFTLGTLTFKNGGWLGAGYTDVFNLPSFFDFFISTTSPDGPAFNQLITGTIKLTVNAPANNNIDTLAGQEAEADWVTIVSSALIQPGNSLRVYDDFAKPPGSSNIGSIDVIAQFNSLDLVGLDNPQGGGFFTAGDEALPNDPFPPVIVPPVGGVPEPASWAMLIAGFGLTGAAMRRRRSASA